MKWLALSLAGPGIWAAGFAGVYALHGAGCALGWPGTALAAGLDLHRAVLWAGWLTTLAAGFLLLTRLPLVADGRLVHQLPRAGAWIGLTATLFTLLPVAVATSC